MNKNISIGALVAVVVVLGVLAFKSPSVVTVPGDIQTIEIPVAKGGGQVVVPAPVVNVSVPEQRSMNVGAVPSTDITENRLSIGGVEFFTARQVISQTASSTVCALKAPMATSSLITGGVNFRLASTTAILAEISNSTTPYASSSARLGLDLVGASASKLVMASSSLLNGNGVFLPGSYFYVGLNQTSGSGSNAPKGVCEAVWMVI